MANFAVLLVLLIVGSVDGVSWRNREHQRTYIVDVELNRPGDAYGQPEPCADQRSPAFCSRFKDQCSNYKIVRKLCKDTCGLCRVHHNPINCSLTRHGCCWDKVTPAKGPNFKGCAPCVDKYSECEHFKDKCANHADIRLICPVTCNVGCIQCADNKYQAHVCKLYKKFKFCHISPDLMQKSCAKTCGFCQT